MRAQPTGLSLSEWTRVATVASVPLFIDQLGTSFFLLRWSHDGKFFARMTLDTLSIYETPVSG